MTEGKGSGESARQRTSIIFLHPWINTDKREERVCISAKVNISPKLDPISTNLEFASNVLCYHLRGCTPLTSQVLPCVELLVEMGGAELAEERWSVKKPVMVL